MAVDAVGLLDLVEDRLVLGEHLAAARDARVADQDVEIVPERLGELRLRIHQVHDPQVGREPARRICRRSRARCRAWRPAATGLRGSDWKFAAACADRGRPASAGWPEEPDSPVHSRGGDGAGAAAATGGWRGRRPGRRRDGPPAAAAPSRSPWAEREPGRAEQQRPANADQANRRECFAHCATRSSLMPPVMSAADSSRPPLGQDMVERGLTAQFTTARDRRAAAGQR